MAEILITGTSRGIGREMAARYAAGGDRVYACARAEADAPTGAGLTPVGLDVTDDASLASLEARLEGASLDLLICNAGALIARGGVDDPLYTRAAFEEVLAVNVTGVFFTIRACLPAIRRGKGKIAIVSSQMGSNARAKGNAYIYRASKAAATNLGSALSKELAAEGIAVGSYHPGWVRTDMGGTEADISVEESAAGLMQRFAALNLDNAGCFEFYSGEPIPF
ncbi:MAG: SDR family oxidoreductase [Pseudomonadota bacterium]